MTLESTSRQSSRFDSWNTMPTSVRGRSTFVPRVASASNDPKLAAELEASWAADSLPWEAAANVILDDVIDPSETRARLIDGIAFAWGSRPRVSPAGT